MLWFAKHAQLSDGIFLLKSVAWDPSVDLSDTTTCFAGACPDGMAYWFPEFNLGFQCRVSADVKNTYYFDALAVTCAILDRSHSASRIFSDNRNTVDIWNSLKASAPYNQLR